MYPWEKLLNQFNVRILGAVKFSNIERPPNGLFVNGEYPNNCHFRRKKRVSLRWFLTFPMRHWPLFGHPKWGAQQAEIQGKVISSEPNERWLMLVRSVRALHANLGIVVGIASSLERHFIHCFCPWNQFFFFTNNVRLDCQRISFNPRNRNCQIYHITHSMFRYCMIHIDYIEYAPVFFPCW